MLWILFSFFSIIFAYLGEERVSGCKNALYFRICLIVLISSVVGLGGGLSTDHREYTTSYYYVNKMSQFPIDNLFDFLFSEIDYMEVGYVVLMRFFYFIGLSHVGMFLVVAFLTNTMIVKTIYRFEIPALILLIFLNSDAFYQQVNLIRQELAISILLYSLIFISEPNVKKYLLCIFFAFLIHHSAIIGLLFIPLLSTRFKNEWLKIMFVIVWAISLYFGIINKNLLNLRELSLLLGVNTEYDMFFTNEDLVGAGDNIKLSTVYNVMILFLILFYKLDMKYRIYATFFIIGGALSNITPQIPNIYRIQIYFTSVYALFLPHLLTHLNIGKKVKCLSSVMLFLITSFYSILLIKSNNSKVLEKMDSIFDAFR